MVFETKHIYMYNVKFMVFETKHICTMYSTWYSKLNIYEQCSVLVFETKLCTMNKQYMVFETKLCMYNVEYAHDIRN